MNKKFRQQRILELVQSRSVPSQEHLRELLKIEGAMVTQSTLSRDIKELGLVKGTRGYLLPPGESANPGHTGRGLENAIRQFLLKCTAAANLVVLRTEPGNAHPLALAVDRVGLEGVLGTVAGDDTVLIVTPGEESAGRLAKTIDDLARGSTGAR
jgi:transcriptional regulator of arginine metabolism